MPSTDLTRRRLLRTNPVALAGLAGLAGCLSHGDPDPAGTQTNPMNETDATTDSETTTTDSAVADGPPFSTSVADFVLYALAGTHPHVHRRANTQYVVVRADVDADARTVRDRLTLTLDGSDAPLADRQPVPWRHETVDVAFAVSKDRTVESGAVRYEGTSRSLSEATVDRLNRPPRFEVSNLSVSPAEIPADEKSTATLRATVGNTGEGAGTFGASLKGNYVSGANTVTVTVDPGTEVQLDASTQVVGGDAAARVTFDWGSDSRSFEIPVRGGETTTVE